MEGEKRIAMALLLTSLILEGEPTAPILLLYFVVYAFIATGLALALQQLNGVRQKLGDYLGLVPMAGLSVVAYLMASSWIQQSVILPWESISRAELGVWQSMPVLLAIIIFLGSVAYFHPQGYNEVKS